MHLSRVQISNFRNFAALDVALDSNAVIVGENRVGKSNINCLRNSIAAKIALSWPSRRLRNSFKGSELSSIGRNLSMLCMGQRGRNGVTSRANFDLQCSTARHLDNPERLPDMDCAGGGSRERRSARFPNSAFVDRARPELAQSSRLGRRDAHVGTQGAR